MAAVSLSHRWAASSHRAVRAASSVEQRLVLAIGPVKSIIRVIDSHVPAMSVDWAQVGQDKQGRPLSTSFTDFRGGRIAINPLPLMLDNLDLGEAIDIEAGFGLHEASHGEESRDRYTDLLDNVDTSNRVNGQWRPGSREVPAFRPMKVAVHLWNLVEDVRIEAATGCKWPGSRPYFAKVLNWVWHHHPVEISDFASHAIEDRMKVIFVACRFPEKIEGLFGASKRPTVLFGKADETALDEVLWWQEWQADYLAARTDVRETVRRGLEHLELDPETDKEMAAMAKDEIKEMERGEKARAQLERLLKEGFDGLPVCITSDGEIVPLSAKQAEAVDKLVREQLISVKPLFTDNDNQCAEVRVTRPEETPESRKAYVGKPTPLVEALRTALVFRQATPQWDLKLQKSGHLDDEELWRLGTGDVRVFSERVIEHRPEVALGLLVDMSGSMAGQHLRTAQRLAQTMLWALHDAEGVQMHVWGHTGDLNAEGSDIFRLWQSGDPMSRLGLVSTLPHGDNYDSFAIGFCVSQMAEMLQPQKVLIVLSDGYPAGREYGGLPAQRHMRHVVDWAERQRGVSVFQVAIDDELRAQDQERMYGPGRWLPYSTDARLPRDLGRLLDRVTA